MMKILIHLCFRWCSADVSSNQGRSSCKKTDLLCQPPSTRKSYRSFGGCWNIYVSKFAEEVAPSELLIGNTVTAGVNKLLVPGDGSWQHVATTEHAYFPLEVSLPEHWPGEFHLLRKTSLLLRIEQTLLLQPILLVSTPRGNFLPSQQLLLYLFIPPSFYFYYRHLPFILIYGYITRMDETLKSCRILVRVTVGRRLLKRAIESILGQLSILGICNAPNTGDGPSLNTKMDREMFHLTTLTINNSHCTGDERWLWIIGGMMTEENRRILSRTCPSVISSTINPIRSGLGLIPGLRSKRPVTNHQIHGRAKTKGNLVSETLCCVRNTRTYSK